jgi:hypothetical protein
MRKEVGMRLTLDSNRSTHHMKEILSAACKDVRHQESCLLLAPSPDRQLYALLSQ